MESQNDRSSEDPVKKETSLWEWIVAGLSAVIVLAAIGYVFYKAVNQSGIPPIIRLEVARTVPTRSGYVMEFWAYNDGETTAKSLAIEGRLKREGEDDIIRQTTLDFVPAESARQGGLFFPLDPRDYDLELYPIGYDHP